MSGDVVLGIMVIGGPLLLAVLGACVGSVFVSGLSYVADRVEERVQARVGARASRLRQGAGVVPAMGPRGRGDEASAGGR